jgi:hypothetical protein
MKSHALMKLAGTAVLGFAMVGGSAAAQSVDQIDHVRITRTYDVRRNFPAAPPADVTGVHLTFDGHHNGMITHRTIQVACNAFQKRTIEQNVDQLSKHFHIQLTPIARQEAEADLRAARSGVCAPVLKR